PNPLPKAVRNREYVGWKQKSQSSPPWALHDGQWHLHREFHRRHPYSRQVRAQSLWGGYGFPPSSLNEWALRFLGTLRNLPEEKSAAQHSHVSRQHYLYKPITLRLGEFDGYYESCQIGFSLPLGHQYAN